MNAQSALKLVTAVMPEKKSISSSQLSFKDRWERATEVFLETLESPLDITEVKGNLRPSSIGFLKSQDDPASLPIALSVGNNNFGEISNSKVADITLIASPGKIDVLTKESSESFVHGDIVTINNKKLKVFLLSARTMAKWFLSLFGFCIFLSSHLAAAAYPVEGQINLSAGSEEIINISIPGLAEFPSNAKAVLKTSKGQKGIAISSVEKVPVHLAILVDSSNLCVMRKMEGALDRQIRDLLLSLDRNSLVSIVEFYRPKPGEKDFSNRYIREEPRTILRKEESLIRCRDDVTSLNALDAIHRVQKDIFSQAETGGRRQTIVLLSAGNIQENSDVKKFVQDKNIQVVSVVYSSIPLGQAENILNDLAKVNRGTTRWWKSGEEFSLPAIFPHTWAVGLRSYLFGLPSDKYNLELQVVNGEKPITVTGQVRHLDNRMTGFFYYLGLTLLALLVLSILGYIVYRLIRYYRTPHCDIHKKPISRRWNKCLFCAEGKEGVLFVQDESGFQRAYVINKRRVSIGPGWGNDIKIKQVKKRQSLIIDQTGSTTFKLMPRSNSQSYVLNSFETVGSSHLRAGDEISIGQYKLQFHFSRGQKIYA